MPAPVISIRGVPTPRPTMAAIVRILAPFVDRGLGLRALDRLYHESGLSGLEPLEFADRALEVLRIELDTGSASIASTLPKAGPVLIVSNHPHGGIEALILMREVGRVRQDLSILANETLRAIPELRPVLIETLDR